MKHESKHQSQEHEQITAKSTPATTTREFATTDELLRHDAAQCLVPPAVADRLAQSLRNEPKPERTWWRRMFGR